MRIAYRVSYLICLFSGAVAARLAAHHRALARASRRWGPMVVLVQLLLLIAWYPARVLSVSSFALCRALVARL